MMKRQYHLIAAAVGLAVAVTLYRSAWHQPVEANPIRLPVAAAAAPAVSLPPPAVATSPAPEAAAPSQAEPASSQADPIAELKRRLDDLNLEQTYGRFFQRLRNLPPEVLEQLKTALAERQLAMERGSLPDHLPVDDAEAKAGKERLDRIQQQADDQMRAAFGEEVYAQYAYFQQSEPLRGSMEQVTNMMRSRGVNVTDAMEEEILAGYTNALAATAKIAAKDTTPGAFQAMSDAARQDLKLKQQSRFDETLAATMSKILSPADFKLFMESEFAQDAPSP
jgi:hypothetical protein